MVVVVVELVLELPAELLVALQLAEPGLEAAAAFVVLAELEVGLAAELEAVVETGLAATVEMQVELEPKVVASMLELVEVLAALPVQLLMAEPLVQVPRQLDELLTQAVQVPKS